MSTSTPSPLRFGNHEILVGPDGKPVLLGEGSFGKTYKARHIFLGTEAALKVIRPSVDAFEKAKTLFLREARSAAQLKHPHIAMIIDFGESDGALYYAMEFCAGGDLHRYIEKHGPFDVESALPLFRQSAGALLCAHERGFLHRDLKPSNFLFATAEPPLDVRLIDFGLVKEFTGARSSEPGETQGPVTETAHFAGTPLFASPEQLREEILDERSDIFSLGMTWWFLLTGKPVVSGATAQVVAERLRPSSYADQLPDSLPAALRDLLGSMLAKERSLRPANAREILESLHSLKDSPGDEGRATARAKPATKWETRPGKLLSHFNIEGPSEPACGGTVAAAIDNANGRSVWLLVFDDPAIASPDARERIVKRCQALAMIESENLVPVLGLLRADDGYAAILARDPGVPLLDVLKACGELPFADCLGQLRRLAQCLDALEMAGLPPTALDPHSLIADAITHQEGFNAPGARILVRPTLLEEQSGADDLKSSSGATMIVESAGTQRPSQAFAALIYRLVSGRALTAVARLTREAFINVSGLSEESNRILAEAVLDHATPIRCADLLATLCNAEGLALAEGSRVDSNTAAARTSKPLHAASVSITLDPSATVSQTPQAPLPAAARVGSAPRPLSGGSTPVPRSTPKSKTSANQPSHRVIPMALATAAAIGTGLVIAGIFTWRGEQNKSHADRPSPHATATPIPSPPNDLPKERPKAPEYFAFTGGITPPTVTFLVNEIAVTPEVQGGAVKVPLAVASGLPLKIAIRAPGFKAKVIDVDEESGAEFSDPIRLGRATGEVSFLGAEGSDYAEATFKMIEALPGETGVRPEASPFTFPLKVTAVSRKLATGIYEVILRGADPAIVQPRKLPITVEIRAGKEAQITIPKSAAGIFFGRDPSGGAIELVIDADLRGGRITRDIDGASRSLTLVGIRLDNTGTITAETSADPSGVVWRLELAQGDPLAKPSLTLSNALTPAGQNPSPPVQVMLERR